LPQGHRTKEELARASAKNAAPVFRLGYPPRPAGLDRQVRRAWNDAAAKLFKHRRLAETDGELLLQYARAKVVCDSVTLQRIADVFKDREPFPEPAITPPAPEPEVDAAPTLAAFLASVSLERATFQERIRPESSITFDTGGVEYMWPEGDAAAVARHYALEVTQGSIVAGELIRRAGQRFLSDLESARERGLFFDPAAARHIVQFSENFCGLKLLAWQVFCLVNIFAWKKPSGARRFTEAWVSCAKKNGKTRLASCVALFGLIADREQYPDVFSAATKKEQSRLVWRDAKRCVQDNQELRDHVQRWAGALCVPNTDGSFTPLSSDEKSMDGLRPHIIIADEVAFWGLSGGGREQWDKLVKGIVSRVQPLVFAVTTAGSTRECFAFGKFDLGEKILRGIFVDDSTFVVIYSIDATDDAMDEKCWPKANPSLGVTLHIEHLKKTRDEVLQAPSGMTSFLQYHANQWADASLNRVGAIPPAKWDACAGLDLIGEVDPVKATAKFLSLNREFPLYAGLDVGLTSDMSAFAMLWKKARFAEGAEPIERPVIVVQFFMPEIGLLEKEKSWNVPLSQWAREGWIQLCPGDMQDPRDLRNYILDAASLFTIRELGFDNWNAAVLCAQINESGALACVSVGQTEKELSAPCRELLQAVHHKELVHFGNPVLAWHAGNVIMTESERTGGVKPEKLSANEKIDGISSVVNGWHRLLNAPPPITWGVRCLDLRMDPQTPGNTNSETMKGNNNA
jgi:phage terminase large subunit-like protein